MKKIIFGAFVLLMMVTLSVLGTSRDASGHMPLSQGSLKAPLGECCFDMQVVNVCQKAATLCPDTQFTTAAQANSVCPLSVYEGACANENSNNTDGSGDRKLSENQDCATFETGSCKTLRINPPGDDPYWVCIVGSANPTSPICGSKKSSLFCSPS